MTMDTKAHRLVVPRSARYLTTGDAEGELDHVWFLCHGYGQLASKFLDFASALAGPQKLLVAPEALSRFYHDDHRTIGATWMTREDRDREIEDYVRYLDLLYEEIFSIVDRTRVSVSVLGYSQGAATAARWAVRGQATVERLVLWGSPLPPELDDETSLAPLRALKLTLVGGTRDEFFTETVWSVERARLQDFAIPFEEIRFEGGHRLDDDTLRRLGN